MNRIFLALMALSLIVSAASHGYADEVTDDTNLIIIDKAHVSAVETGGEHSD